MDFGGSEHFNWYILCIFFDVFYKNVSVLCYCFILFDDRNIIFIDISINNIGDKKIVHRPFNAQMYINDH